MNGSTAALAASYEFCRRTSRQAHSSFRGSFFFLPVAKRRAMEALYAFMRHTDDLGDNPQPVDQRRQALAAWRGELDRALKKTDGGAASLSPAQALLPAVADAVRRYRIPPQYLHAVIDGQEMDLAGCRYETFAELALYCQRVASAVGLACLFVWGFTSDAALQPANSCGIAFQLTNILRDLDEDAQNGRVYLPAEDFRAAGYSVDDLHGRRTGAAFGRLMALEIGRAREHYQAAAPLARWLHPDGRRTFRAMHAVYGRLLENIAADPAAVFRRRVRLSPWQKLRIVAQSFFSPGWNTD